MKNLFFTISSCAYDYIACQIFNLYGGLSAASTHFLRFLQFYLPKKRNYYKILTS
ncbi:hypothetical protein JCM15548_12527 [Geofilum rubicundum JCM 15548]|uniref:Uncharacterized protein n=1 Tax=Geofilum rubicundum JCM 15548 TaxID=1236989 RepID=A0A0E9LXF6_9BACT|nr:hypothetical protein JCM15548_12527 [Geofilum rubicundum JCM 15548]